MISLPSLARAENQGWQEIGDNSLAGWTGLKAVEDGATLPAPGEATFRYPDGPRGNYNQGFRAASDSAADWHDYWGVRLQVKLPESIREAEFTFTIRPSPNAGLDKPRTATVWISGAGWQTVSLPWSAFDFEQAASTFLRKVKTFSISIKPTNGTGGQITIRHPSLILAPATALRADVQGKPCRQGDTVAYPITVINTTDEPQSVTLSLVRHGWETMSSTIEPAAIRLEPGATQQATLRVAVSDRVPPGGHESQVVQAITQGNGESATRLTFTTTSALPHPYVLHDSKRWTEVKDKVAKFGWAKEAQDGIVQRANRWVVPEIAKPPRNDPNDNYGPFVFATSNEHDLMACGYSWQLTGNKDHAEKAAEFLRRLSDPNSGYPKTLRACNQSLVQEGHFFQHVAMAYDMIFDASVLSDADKQQIDATLRMLMETMSRSAENGSINNWNLSEACGAFYCALVMQDLVSAERFFSGPAGIKDQLSKGTMDDGWWYECAISYNMWCASEFTQVALAYEPFGVNFRDMWVPASYSPRVMLSSELSGGNGIESPDPKMKGKPFGMDPSVYGPSKRAYRTIADLWNGLLPFIDYRGVMFAVNDSMEMRVGGNRVEVGAAPFELAYYVFGDPRYAAMIKQSGGGRDLLYGVPDLPEKTPELFRQSAHADNVGLAMLRSQTPNRPMREQIQAVLHFGTHGWAHGHYDRTNLLHLSRYGRSFYNPEMAWQGYANFLYKFYVQESVSKNMVVVDQKQQEATPGTLRLFHTGKAMQATAVDTVARWSYPSYGGMVYDYVTAKSFEEKTWDEGRYVPIPKDHPRYGTLTDFTEPILQRRLMVVTDDYVLLADYLKAENEHTFESLFQIKGFQELVAANKQTLRHDTQWSNDPLSSAQFVTDADWFSASAPSLARFETRYGPGEDPTGFRPGTNENGVLKLDVRTLWPEKQELMVAAVPEDLGVEKRLYYTVRGDGRVLAEGKFGAWILGKGDIDVSLDGITQLELETKIERSKKPSLFWAGAVVVTRDGHQIPLEKLSLQSDNIIPAATADRDYAGGAVKIAGTKYESAIAAEPRDDSRPAVVRVNLSGVDAVRLKAVVGADFPPGDESQRRKTFAVRSKGKEARYLTVLEPYEDKQMVKTATAIDENTLRVDLNDGRTQDITITNLAGSGDDVGVKLVESRNGNVTREETTSSQN